jgi:chromate transporter
MIPDSSTTEEKGVTPPVSLASLAMGMCQVTMFSFGGGVSAWAQLVIVEQRRWLSEEEFLSALTFCRVLPGANQLNMAVYVGARLRGFPGVLAALAGMLTLPFCFILLLGYVYLQYHDVPEVKDALHGAAAATVALMLALGFKTAAKSCKRVDDVVFLLVTFFAVGVKRWSLIPTLSLLAPLAVWWYWPREPPHE